MAAPGLEEGEKDLTPVQLILISVASFVLITVSIVICGFCRNLFRKRKSQAITEKDGAVHMKEETTYGKKTPWISRQLITNKLIKNDTTSETALLTHNHDPRGKQLYRSLSAENGVLLTPDIDPAGTTVFQKVQPNSRRAMSLQASPSGDRHGNQFEQPRRKVAYETIQPDLFTNSASLSSLGESLGLMQAQALADAVPLEENLGRINFTLRYEFTEQTLMLRIIKAESLPAKDFSGTSDPFVKILLLPDKKTKLETQVKRKNLNPIWNETFLFQEYPYTKIQERILHLQVLDYDRFSRNDPIGEVNMPLSEVDLTQESVYWKSLSASKKSSGKLGSVLLSICYSPTSCRITICIMKCQNLIAKDITGKSDPYVKIWHMHKGKKVEKVKTSVKYSTLNPVYNESFIFHVPLDRMRDTMFVITVMDKDRLSRNDVIGGLILGPKASQPEMNHWNDMLHKPRTPVAQWHLLKNMS